MAVSTRAPWPGLRRARSPVYSSSLLRESSKYNTYRRIIKMNCELSVHVHIDSSLPLPTSSSPLLLFPFSFLSPPSLPPPPSRNYLESETDRVMSYLQELRLYFASFIANVINSFPRGDMRIRLFNSEMRYNLFYLFSTWCGMFGFMKESEQELR